MCCQILSRTESLRPSEDQALINVQGGGNEAPVEGTPAPYAQQWNFDIQRQFPGNLLVDVALCGVQGHTFAYADQTLNHWRPSLCQRVRRRRAALNQLVFNPFAGNCPPGTVPACTGPVLAVMVGTSPK